jgi:hypothetical protein
MTYSRSRLISNRVVTTSPGNVTIDRYQYLDLSSAEPNLGTSANGNVLTTDIYGNRVWSNVLTLQTLTITGNTTSGNVLSSGYFWANGTPFTSSNFGNANVVAALANLGSNNISTTGNITSGNITTINGIFWSNGAAYSSGIVFGNANVVAALATLGSNSISTTGNVTAGNVISTFYGNIYVDTITPNKTAVTIFNSSTAIGLPVGGNVARPSSPSAGEFRYNSDLLTVEFYNGTGWVSLSNTITSQEFNGDNSTVTFTLNSATTAVGILVSVNGTVQQPGIAYTVTGNQITFAEAPLITDTIDIRFLSAATTASYDTQIIDSGNILVTASNTIADSFSSGTYRSVKYLISSTTATDSHMAEVLVTQNSGVVFAKTIGNVNTNTNTITYYANINGTTVNFLAQGTISSNIRIQRIYFNA